MFGAATLDYSVVVTNKGPTGTANGVSFIDSAPATRATREGGEQHGEPWGDAIPVGRSRERDHVLGRDHPGGWKRDGDGQGNGGGRVVQHDAEQHRDDHGPGRPNPANNTSTVSTTIACADLNVAFTDVSPLGGFFGGVAGIEQLEQLGALHADEQLADGDHERQLRGDDEQRRHLDAGTGIGQVTTNPGGVDVLVHVWLGRTSNTYTCSGPLAASGSVVLDFSTGSAGTRLKRNGDAGRNGDVDGVGDLHRPGSVHEWNAESGELRMEAS